VIAQLKSAAIDDAMLGRCMVREDGRNVHDMRLMEIKKPSDAHGELDFAKVDAVIPGDEAFRPLTEGHCPMASG
jgi:branched-chain amino acid transport system substrate-binding protein